MASPSRGIMASSSDDIQAALDEHAKRVWTEIETRLLPRCTAKERSFINEHLKTLVKFTPWSLSIANHTLTKNKPSSRCPEVLRWALVCFIWGMEVASNRSTVAIYIGKNPKSLKKFKIGNSPCVPIPKIPLRRRQSSAKRKVQSMSIEEENGREDAETDRRSNNKQSDQEDHEGRTRVAKQVNYEADGETGTDSGNYNNATSSMLSVGAQEEIPESRQAAMTKLMVNSVEQWPFAMSHGIQEDQKALRLKYQQMQVDSKNRQADLRSREADLKNREADLRIAEADMKCREIAIKNRESDIKNRDISLQNRDAIVSIAEASLRKREVDVMDKEANIGKYIQNRIAVYFETAYQAHTAEIAKAHAQLSIIANEQPNIAQYTKLVESFKETLDNVSERATDAWDDFHIAIQSHGDLLEQIQANTKPVRRGGRKARSPK
ncbi:hypothetical protein NLG97_g723 [Lecanicillium saksenae]|uniref:Uncharacterized protein n=1 Tax=Lecanicillium saksenae TaxID=468837 RepID=A0ACC1R789_9HYPO|nr:hypothetical protein NLG97_g723 [Lecanicillium saksenae]